jgi:hypothetical protein
MGQENAARGRQIQLLARPGLDLAGIASNREARGTVYVNPTSDEHCLRWYTTRNITRFSTIKRLTGNAASFMDRLSGFINGHAQRDALSPSRWR